MFPVIDGQELWVDWYHQPVGTTGLKAMVDAYRKAGNRDGAKT